MTAGVTADVRAALLRKYRLLARWRRAKDAEARGAGEATGGATAGEMRALAEEFPGALRELDLLGLAELERRAAHLATAPEYEPANENANENAKWIAWISAYHALLRLALALRGPTPPAATPSSPADEMFLSDVRRPPGGRLSAVVLQALGRHFGLPAEEIRAVLFPPRR
jgi:hypothetical protein